MIVARRHERADPGEMRWMCNRRQHLCRADVRSSEHSYFPVRIRKRRRPFHRVVTVLRLIAERIPLSFRCVASAYVLDNAHVTGCGRAIAERHATTLVVRSALEQNRKAALLGGSID